MTFDWLVLCKYNDLIIQFNGYHYLSSFIFLCHLIGVVLHSWLCKGNDCFRSQRYDMSQPFSIKGENRYCFSRFIFVYHWSFLWNANLAWVAVLTRWIYKGIYTLGFRNVPVGRINGVTALTGFYYKKMYGRFARTKTSGCNNEVPVWRGSIVTWCKSVRSCSRVTESTSPLLVDAVSFPRKVPETFTKIV